MNFARLNEIFCKQVVSEIGRLHKHHKHGLYTRHHHCQPLSTSNIFLLRMFDVSFH